MGRMLNKIVRQRQQPTGRTFRLATLLTLIIILIIPGWLFAAEKKVYILTSNDSVKNTRIAEKLEQFIQNKCHSPCKHKTLIQQYDSFSNIETQSDDLVITLGLSVYEKSLKKEKPINWLHALLPLQEHADKTDSRHYYWIEQSLENQINQIRSLSGNDKKLYILFSKDSSWRVEEIRKPSNKNLILLQVEAENIGFELKKNELKNNIVLLIPDKKLFNRNNLKQVLLTGYMNKIILVGYSKSLTMSGTAYSVATDLLSYLREIAEAADNFMTGKSLLKKQFPKQHIIYLNQNILDSLITDGELSTKDRSDIKVVIQ